MRIDGESPVAAAAHRGAAASDAELVSAAKAFEQQLLGMLAQELERSSSLLGSDEGDSASGVAGGGIADALAQSLADAGGLGLADELTRSIAPGAPTEPAA